MFVTGFDIAIFRIYILVTMTIHTIDQLTSPADSHLTTNLQDHQLFSPF